MTAHRFSDDDLIEILNATGLRSLVMRDNGPGHDRLDLLIPHLEGQSYRFEKDATGHVHLLHASPDDLRLLASGSLSDCLDMFIPRFPA